MGHLSFYFRYRNPHSGRLVTEAAYKAMPGFYLVEKYPVNKKLKQLA